MEASVSKSIIPDSLNLAITRAVEWWCKTLSSPVFDNGDSSLGGLLVNTTATMLAHTQKPSEDKFEIFADNLKIKLTQAILEAGDAQVILAVDYGPEGILREAAEIALIPYSQFPYKTVMWFQKGVVRLRYGYGAPIKYLFYTKDWLEDKIQKHLESMKIYPESAEDYKRDIIEFETMKTLVNEEGYYLCPIEKL